MKTPFNNKHLLKSTLALAVALSLSGCSSSNDNDDDQDIGVSPSATVSLRVMETTDIHMYLSNYDYFAQAPSETLGLVNTATLIKEARAEVPNSVLVDNGDLIQNSPLGDYEALVRKDDILNGATHVAYKAMNLLDYDVANLGNHEFNFGLEFLDATLVGADFPYVNANVYVDDGDNDESNDQNRYTPYYIQDKIVFDSDGNEQTVKIGYLGLTPPQIMQWDNAHLQDKVIAKDIVATAEKFVPQMKEEGADIVIAIPHSGLTASAYESMAENTALYLSQVEGIDAILFGHNHRVFPGDAAYDGFEEAGIDNVNGTLNGVPAVMPGFFGNHLGIIDLELEPTENGGWQVASSAVSNRAISTKDAEGNFVDLAEADGEIAAAIELEHKATIDWVSEPFAKISAPIFSFFALVQDDPSIQIVADAQIAWGRAFIQGTELDGLPVLSAAAPFRAGRNGVEDYTHVKAGEIAMLDTVSLYVFPNTIRMVKVSGGDVKEWLERSAGQFNQIDMSTSAEQNLLDTSYPTFNFDIIDGVTFEIDVTQPKRYDNEGVLINPESSRIVNLQYQGQAIDPEAEFLVVTNNYRASGGGNFPAIDGSSRETFEGPDENRGVLRSYIISEAAKSPETGLDPSADNNWRFAKVSTDTPLNVVFRTSPLDDVAAIAETLPAVTPTSPLKLDENGFALYRIDLQQ
ncbi:bifunctional 2',3'-cyclic-nucleotide 2'-phosphodiesterase/3'-nucleotidase [Pseudoalteromonas sp. T1lg10]|uniref:bifunctional 2',3'-cyclic-nucleotide 2'-phosphodiesterase/3'-nucleotidase n=1 Tax=Pseudoalteromonas sp. T1lg10 TaxID=2077093 RepID=UPI000CF5E3A2|nr:bifunctional 2',3'-cyclic-nucleotide 2'-phosphodiesterase/3'-nucleotidase [Pseudoalteromonas sp. T1lg10]